jgi:hypothetical protein
MKLIYALTALVLTFTAQTGFAHGDAAHSHGPVIKVAKAQSTASSRMEELVKKGKIEKSWSGAKANKPAQKDFGHGKEWIVTFDNKAARDKSKSKLYIFVNNQGKITGSNFTGN